ncbi:N-acetylmuramoyl-L-alanine amidase [Roseivivax halodurans JCM 10272]|uniref:N-acetylmuramoyl-L-alanine amidase n=1 Tax=Roseivivax halodurans JCM 10272 TaxID=1449350 RepID=X7EMW1_9RHOB|nr:N-acetylmuramoyl-L-alanine amidase [Roseivivax halodurans JCM 10272]
MGASLLWAGAAPAQDAGGVARLDPDASAVRDIWGGARIDLALSEGVPWRVFTLTEPPRLLLEFRELDWGEGDPQSIVSGAKVRALRPAVQRPGWSRLVAELGGPMRISFADLRIDGSGAAKLSVRLGDTDAETFAALSGTARNPLWDMPEPAGIRAMPERDGVLRVMLDPGHGGVDPGAQHGGATEAELMMTFARDLKDVLLRSGGFDVEMTRSGDGFMSLEGRVAAAHRAGAEVFVSLHADALEDGVARGATVYSLADSEAGAASAALVERHERADLLAGLDLSGADDRVAGVLMDLARLDTQPRSRALAEAIVAGIAGSGGSLHKRPLRQAGFSVLKAADIPSVLVELGFLSTDAELRNMRDAEWRARMARGIRDGLRAWQVSDAAAAELRRK